MVHLTNVKAIQHPEGIIKTQNSYHLSSSGQKCRLFDLKFVQPYLYISQQKSWAGWEKNLTAIFYAPFSLPDHIFEHSGYRCSQKLLSKMAVAYSCYVSSSKKRFFQSLLLATAAASKQPAYSWREHGPGPSIFMWTWHDLHWSKLGPGMCRDTPKR